MSLWKVFLQPIAIRRLALTSGGYFRTEDGLSFLVQETNYRFVLENSSFASTLAAQALTNTAVTTGFQPLLP